MKVKIVHIAKELKNHAPFTAFGAATGVAIMLVIVFFNVPGKISYTAFYILHPAHIILSALTTTAMYRLHNHSRLWVIILIGYTGSIGIATLSDALIPYAGMHLLGIKIPFSIPFMEELWITPLAFVGIAIGYLLPTTKFPHAGHVLLSTWASLFYITQHKTVIQGWMLFFIFLFLFLSVWLPCCISDIVYPLLFFKNKEKEHLSKKY
ncbi:hypothetical protein IBX65_07015 [Candidatus Aerophobetes bacterium]|nr:hypothetical protein [Candidatus Aerophobetes bacterium]